MPRALATNTRCPTFSPSGTVLPSAFTRPGPTATTLAAADCCFSERTCLPGWFFPSEVSAYLIRIWSPEGWSLRWFMGIRVGVGGAHEVSAGVTCYSTNALSPSVLECFQKYASIHSIHEP